MKRKGTMRADWEITGDRNFLGEKIVRRVTMQPGVDIETSKSQKDELTLQGNSLEHVSQSAADIQQKCRVKNKDIRKVGKHPLDQSPVGHPANVPTCIVLGRSVRVREGQHCRRGMSGGMGMMWNGVVSLLHPGLIEAATPCIG